MNVDSRGFLQYFIGYLGVCGTNPHHQITVTNVTTIRKSAAFVEIPEPLECGAGDAAHLGGTFYEIGVTVTSVGELRFVSLYQLLA